MNAPPAKDEILNVRAEAVRRRDPLSRRLARVSGGLAHPLFLLAEIAFHLGWVALNSVPWIEPWDPYPYPMMTGLASAQGLFIGLLILMHAKRDERVVELRDETHLQVSLHAEREVSRLIEMVDGIRRAMGEPTGEPEVERMKRPIEPRDLTERTARRLEESEE